jgi:hypothetical protein
MKLSDTICVNPKKVHSIQLIPLSAWREKWGYNINDSFYAEYFNATDIEKSFVIVVKTKITELFSDILTYQQALKKMEYLDSHLG